MRLCFSSSELKEVSIPLDTGVQEAKKQLGQLLGIEPNLLYLIYKGRILESEISLRDSGMCSCVFLSLGLTEDSIIHIVISRELHTEPSTNSDESSFKASETFCEDHFSRVSAENEYQEEEPIIASVILHIFGDAVKSCQTQDDFSKAFCSIQNALDLNPSLMKEVISTPLFQDIMSDISVVRQLLLSNPLITELIDSNPKLLDFLNDDSHLQDLINVLSNTENYPDLAHLRRMVVQKIEKVLGNRLQFAPFEDKLSPPPADSSTESTLSNSSNLAEKGDRRCREDHITLLCQIIAHRPDIVKTVTSFVSSEL